MRPSPPEAVPPGYEAAGAPNPDPGLAELRAIRRRLTIVAVVTALAAASLAQEIIMPIMMGFLLAMTLSPIVRAAGRRGVPAPLSAVILVVALGTGGFLTAYSMSGTVSGWLDRAPTLGYEVKQRLESVTRSFEAVKKAADDVDDATGGGSSGSDNQVVVKESSLLANVAGGLAAAGTSLAVALVLALFLLSSGQLFYAKLLRFYPRLSDKKNALRVIYDIERRISRYLFTIALINFGLGVVVGTSLHLIGMPYAPVWGALVFALNFLPFIGTVVGTALVGAVALVSFDSLSYAALAPAAYLFWGSLEGQVVTPAIIGRRMEINTVSVFLMVMFWGWIWGVAGALIAVPMLVAFKVICDNVSPLTPIGAFLGAEDSPLESDDAK